MSHSSTESLWYKKALKVAFPALAEELEVDVAIIGGGIAGMTIGHVLKQSGLSVAVLEKNTIASGTTAGTTGKVTTQHGIIYSELMKHFGQVKTQLYARTFQAALDDIAKLIGTERIACDWQQCDNFVYTADKHRVGTFKNEARTATKLGLPATFETSTELPFVVKGAVKFAHQAKFNAVAYTQHLAQRIQGGGSHVFEQSQATAISERPHCQVSTKNGKIKAKHIVIATKIPPAPLAARISYGLVEYPQTSYLIAGKTSHQLKAMYISPDKHHYSLLHTGTHLLIGGEKHIPGLGLPAKRCRKLLTYGQQYFGLSHADYQWKAMDYIAYDNLPVIGKLYPWSHNTYAVTGFKKWGLSTSMVAAKIIRDLLSQQPTPEAKLFYPHRISAPLAIPRALKRDRILSL